MPMMIRRRSIGGRSVGVISTGVMSVALACAVLSSAVNAATADGVTPPGTAPPKGVVSPAAAVTPVGAANAADAATNTSRPMAKESDRPVPRRNIASRTAPPRARTGGAASANLQHSLRTNAEALHKVMSAPARSGQVRQPVHHQIAARPAPAATAVHAQNSSGMAQTSATRVSMATPSHRPPSPQPIVSNSTPGSHRAPTGLVAIGGAPIRRSVGNASVNGNAIRHPF
jgi:hypothetical protein